MQECEQHITDTKKISAVGGEGLQAVEWTSGSIVRTKTVLVIITDLKLRGFRVKLGERVH